MAEISSQAVTVSVVSHGHGRFVAKLLEDLARCRDVEAIILTQNIHESDISCPESLRSRVRLIQNVRPLGFAANHNQAFRYCETPLFAVLNPDIRLETDPFPPMATVLRAFDAGLVAPEVRNPGGGLEDSARHFPTFLQLFRKLLGKGDGRVALRGSAPQPVDWTAGMFLLFSASVFRDIGGFDEGYFLYYEDVDICARLWKSGRRIILHPGVSVVHAAQRASRRKLRYMVWHLSSMARYFRKHSWLLPRQGDGA